VKGLQDNRGVVHIPTDGYEDGLGKDASDPWFALCQIEAMYSDDPCPTVTWTNEDVREATPNCMACLAVDLEELRRTING